MADLILYLGMIAMGYVIGIKTRFMKKKIWWIGNVQMVVITVLVFVMGLRMGANDEVIANLDSIGLYAFIMTIVTMVFSAISISATRRFMRINKHGIMISCTEENGAPNAEMEEAETEKGKIDMMTVLIVAAVIVGIACGYFFVEKIFSNYQTFDDIAGWTIKVWLCVLLTFAGMDMGLDGNVVKNFRKVGMRILVFPVATIVGTMVAALICSLILPVSTKESLAIAAGFGWYTLAPGIIMENGYAIASAISFMHNVMRELFGIIAIPIVAKKVGYIETTGLPGAAAMDVCLPIVERATNGNIAVYSFISGVVLTVIVPILVPLIIG